MGTVYDANAGFSTKYLSNGEKKKKKKPCVRCTDFFQGMNRLLNAVNVTAAMFVL